MFCEPELRIASSLVAATENGTDCSELSRFCAVTMTCSSGAEDCGGACAPAPLATNNPALKNNKPESKRDLCVRMIAPRDLFLWRLCACRYSLSNIGWYVAVRVND